METTQGHDGRRRTRWKTYCKTMKRRQRGRGEKSDGFDECNANYKTRNVSLQGFSSFHHTFLFFIACYGTSRFRDVTFAFSDMETHAG